MSYITPKNPEKLLDAFLKNYAKPGPVPLHQFAEEFLVANGFRADAWNRRDVKEMVRARRLMNRDGTVNIF